MQRKGKLIVSGFMPGSLARQSGCQVGDILRAVDDNEVIHFKPTPNVPSSLTQSLQLRAAVQLAHGLCMASDGAMRSIGRERILSVTRSARAPKAGLEADTRGGGAGTAPREQADAWGIPLSVLPHAPPRAPQVSAPPPL